MGRPDPIEYAERLYGAIRAANFSPLSFLAFGNAVKDGIAMRNMPRIAVEPFMRVVGEMIDFETVAAQTDIVDADVIPDPAPSGVGAATSTGTSASHADGPAAPAEVSSPSANPPTSAAAEADELPPRPRPRRR